MSHGPSSITHRAVLNVPSTHPALPGHFPGRPLVPGVLLLDLVLSAAEQWLKEARPLRTLQQVKFLAPLLPDERVDVELSLNAQELRFTVQRGAELIAQGVFKLASGDA